MKVALVGYGAMGRLIHQLALERGVEVVAIIDTAVDEATHRELCAASISEADVAIDFTHPSVIMEHINKYCECSVPVVVGTTGWYDELLKVKTLVEKTDSLFLWGSNFSIGVNAYYKIVEASARLFNSLEEYDVWGMEVHHHNKADSPSGTAISVSDIVLSQIERKESVVFEKLDRKIDPKEFHFASVRGGAVNFEHKLTFDSVADSVTISHSARSREGYASGALTAASWLLSQSSGFYSLDDLVEQLMSRR
jgi:4-hydroxy-tetrahydrodipicolinate reductase